MIEENVTPLLLFCKDQEFINVVFMYRQWFVEKSTDLDLCSLHLGNSVEGKSENAFWILNKQPTPLFWCIASLAAQFQSFFWYYPKHTSLHFLCAVIEGISFLPFQTVISLEETIGTIHYIYASGSFVQSALWLQHEGIFLNNR